MNRLRDIFKIKFHRPRNPFRRKKKQTFVAHTYGEAQEILKKMGPEDTLLMDEDGPPLFSPSHPATESARAEPKRKRKKKVRRCGDPDCDKELPDGWSMKVCATCAARLYGTPIKDPPSVPPEEYAEIERGKDGKPRFAPVSVKGAKNQFRRNVLVGCVVVLLVCSGITVLSQYQPPVTPGYYVVYASMVETATGDPSAAMMTLYLYQNDSWVEHDERTALMTEHIFSPIPLGVWASVWVREGIGGDWSPVPAFARAVFVNSTTSSEEIAFIWDHYTIILEGRGSDVLDI